MSDEATRLLDEADRLANSGDDTRILPAIRAYEAALAADPDNADALVRKAVMHRAIDDFDGALDAISRALAIAPDHPKANKDRLGILESIFRMTFSDPYHVETLHVEMPRHRISHAGGPEGLLNELLDALDGPMLDDDDMKTFRRRELRAGALGRLGRIDEAIAEHEACLIHMPDELREATFLPATPRHQMAIARLLAAAGEPAKAIEWFDRAREHEPLGFTHREKIAMLATLGRRAEADDLRDRIIAAIGDQLETTGDIAYLSQLVGLHLANDDPAGARAALSNFERAGSLTERQHRQLTAVDDRLVAVEVLGTPSATLRSIIELRSPDAEFEARCRTHSQLAIEFISWHHPIGDDVGDLDVLDGLHAVVPLLADLDYPVAEYNTSAEVLGLFGAALGELLRHRFGWSWRFGTDVEAGAVGPLVVSPDDRLGLLVEEYLRQRIGDEARDDLRLYRHLSEHGPSPLVPQPTLLGGWRSRLGADQVLNDGSSA